MQNNIERFMTNIDKFEDEGIDINVVGNKVVKKYVPIGTSVKIKGIDQEITIERTFAVFNGTLYDYQGLINTNNGYKKIYFNNENIIDYERYILNYGGMKK